LKPFSVDSSGVRHGFLRDKNGAFTEFDVPGAGAGVFFYSIAPSGAVTGYFWDTNNVVHGFTRNRKLSSQIVIGADAGAVDAAKIVAAFVCLSHALNLSRPGPAL
jgi:hypothetical protein